MFALVFFCFILYNTITGYTIHQQRTQQKKQKQMKRKEPMPSEQRESLENDAQEVQPDSAMEWDEYYRKPENMVPSVFGATRKVHNVNLHFADCKGTRTGFLQGYHIADFTQWLDDSDKNEHACTYVGHCTNVIHRKSK
jgi:hypothetical protein